MHNLEKKLMVLMLKIFGFIKEEDGVTAIEYALIASLVAVIIVGSVTTIGQVLLGFFNVVANSF